MILMNDFKAEPAALREAMVGAVRRVLESGWYVLGSEVSSFERQWAQACGVDHAVGVANGLDAIEICLRSLDIGPGDEVITTPMTAFATVLAILRAGAVPVLADIDADSGLLSSQSVIRCITRKTRAVLLVHLYGQLRDPVQWRALCDAHDVHFVEDCAQAHLAAIDGRVSGSFGEAGAYSFYPTKNLGAPGDAGILVTNSEAIAQTASRLRNYGQSERYHHPVIGMNSRLDEVHAAMLMERLKWLGGFTDRRRSLAQAYANGIRNPLVRLLARPQQESAHVHHLFVVCCDRREALMAHLKSSNVQSLIHYPIPVHRQEPCRDLRRDPDGLHNSEVHAATCLSLPCHPQMSDSDVQHVIDAVNAFRAG
jgi:dTDP-4-amino-4,6-dideoxygalactose transaminase